MNHLLAVVLQDMRLQARNKLWFIGVGVAVLMGVMVRFMVPVEHIGRGLSAFYLLGLGGTTFMFGASMLLLEKGERTLAALRVTMVRTRAYLASKALTLTGFALVESAIVYAIAARGVPTSIPLLLLGAGVLGVAYTLLGLALAAPHDAVTRFLLPTGTAVAMVLQLPFLSLLGLGPDWIWYLIPSQAALLLLQSAFEPLAPWQWGYALGVSALSLAGVWWFAALRFRRHIGLSE